ncbi:MAG: dihydrodipicolinate reductase [Deltaproteobacteria bacterium]|nr:dihydrodipicolinate reductase [Deltaproteobacteria bacterium]MBW2632816.1 dihydrodipicolinate reductase [Deltaproteobacteria bacterium]MBW2677280.1 dihydrodipicolinate reductase [Deltaproteobacteria bacterium]
MSPINVMINGLPGNVSRVIARHIQNDNRFNLLPWSLTGPEIEEPVCNVEPAVVQLINPKDRESILKTILTEVKPFITVDYTHPSAVNDNAAFYCRHQLPFVMGTTGGDRSALENTVEKSQSAAVIAPNMAKQIVGFQAMMAWAANTFPDLFKGYSLSIRESHQQGKADTSGTARAMVGYFNNLGLVFSADDIQMERDPEIQAKTWGIPERYLDGHGWHTYTLDAEDQTVKFEFTHNISGREIYAQGTMDAIVYLDEKVRTGSRGRVFSMIDVLKGV